MLKVNCFWKTENEVKNWFEKEENVIGSYEQFFLTWVLGFKSTNFNEILQLNSSKI